MGALKGAVTVRRYVVAGDPPGDRGRIMKGIRAHAHMPIDPDGEVERAHGWASLQDPEQTELTTGDVFVGDVVTLALRVDTLKPPAAVVKRLVGQKLKELGRKPTRVEKDQARLWVKKKLRGRYEPTIRAVDVVWQVDAGRVLFWSHGKALNETLVDLFAKSFGLELRQAGPGVVGGRRTVELLPTPEMVAGFAGMPGRTMTEDADA